MGEVGIAPSEFWDMTLREILNAYKGHINKETRLFQLEWERIRWLGAIQENTFRSKRIQPSDLLKFPWEKPKDISKELELLTERRKWAHAR